MEGRGWKECLKNSEVVPESGLIKTVTQEGGDISSAHQIGHLP